MSSSTVENWTVDDVTGWLKDIGLEKYADLFTKHEINGEILLTMKEEDLSAPPLNVRAFGAVRKFALRLQKLKQENNRIDDEKTTETTNNPFIVNKDSCDDCNKGDSLRNKYIPMSQTPRHSSKVSVEKNSASFPLIIANEVVESEIEAVQTVASTVYSKVEKTVYKSDLEAFLNGETYFDDDDDLVYSDEEAPKPKTKKLRQIKREILLKAQGKLPVSEVEQIYTDQMNGAFFQCVKEYAKQMRPPKGVARVNVVKVMSFREIYLRTDAQNELLTSLEQKLQNAHKSRKLQLLPDRLIECGFACAYRDDDGRLYRGRIGEVGRQSDDDIPVVLVDHGRMVFATRANRNRFIFALPAMEKIMLKEFQVYKCKMYKLCESASSNAELALLKEMLPVGKVFNCYFDRDREPWRIHLEYQDSLKDFVEVFEEQSGGNAKKRYNIYM